MKGRNILQLWGAAVASLGMMFGLTASLAQADGTRVNFEITDEPGAWFKNTAGPIAGTQSLAVQRQGSKCGSTENPIRCIPAPA